MKKIYRKDGDFWKEIEWRFDEKENEYVLTKRNVSGKNSQGHSMSFSIKEAIYLKNLIKAFFSIGG